MRPNFFNNLSAPLPTSSDLQLFSCSLNFSHLFSPLLTSSHLSHLFSPLLHISSHSTLVSPLLVSPQLFSPFRTCSQHFSPSLNPFLTPSCLALAPLNFSHRLSTFLASSQLFSRPFSSCLSSSQLLAHAFNFTHLFPLFSPFVSTLLISPPLFSPFSTLFGSQLS